MKNRVFYLYQNSTELNLIKAIINLLPSSECEHFLFCVDTSRIHLKSISDLPIKKIIIEDIIYSKRLYKELKKSNKLKNILSSLKINAFDTFVTQPIYTLNNFILYKAFRSKKSKIISYALNSVKLKNNNMINLNLFLSLKHSIYTLLYSRKIVFFFNLKNTKHNFVFTNTKSNIHIDFGRSIKNELINSNYNLKFDKLSTESQIENYSNKVLVLIRSHSSNLLFGISEETYLLRIKKIIQFLKSKSFSVIVKNHPSSIISKKLIAQKLNIGINSVIDSKEDLESYLLIRKNEFTYFLTEDSNVAHTLNLFNLNYSTINELIRKDSSNFSLVFGLNRLLDLNDMKIKSKTKSNFNLNKKLFNNYFNQI